jgi:hypothetical protein
MASFRGVRVSTYWKTVLEAAEKAGVSFTLQSGQRTMAEQWALWRNPPAGTPLVAFPSPNAPHIRTGRQDHALDQGGGLACWLSKQGAHIMFPVGGEPWHLEINGADLKRLYKKFRNPFAGYPADEQRWLTEYDDLKRRKANKLRRSVLRRVMKERRQSIFREAQKTGWRKNNRTRRYASLRARS